MYEEKNHIWNRPPCIALSLKYTLPNILLTLHPQLKDSHLRMSGSRRSPSFIHLTPCLSWRDRVLAKCATPPSPAASSPTGQYHELYGMRWLFWTISLHYRCYRNDSDDKAEGKSDARVSETHWKICWRLKSSKLSRRLQHSGHLFCSFTGPITPAIPLLIY